MMETDPSETTLLAFVDEIGDRGHSKKSSEYFAMSAVIFSASSQQKVKDCIEALKTKLGINLKTPLHWRKHCHRHDVRKYITEEIAKLNEIKVIYVISDKSITPEDHIKFYNLVAAFTLERILEYTEELNTKVCVRFGHVRGFNHLSTLDYFNKRNWRLYDFNRLSDQPKWIPVDSNSGIQLADLYSGILGAAMIPDRFGNYEAAYLQKIKHQIQKSSHHKIDDYGIRTISADNDPKSFKWWPEGWT